MGSTNVFTPTKALFQTHDKPFELRLNQYIYIYIFPFMFSNPFAEAAYSVWDLTWPAAELGTAPIASQLTRHRCEANEIKDLA
jgi:hypothetical protein